MNIAGFEPIDDGRHCETTALVNLLKFEGLAITEPMLFGLGQGLGFIVFPWKGQRLPFIGGRRKPHEITVKAAQSLGCDLDVRTTRSRKKAWSNVASFVEAGQPVGLKLDCYHLEYFEPKVHFAGHFVVVYGFDATTVCIADTAGQGRGLCTSRESLEEARFAKGPMSSSALSWTLSYSTATNWPNAVREALCANAVEMLQPPIRNFGHAGIRKAAKMVPGWLEGEGASDALAEKAFMMEHAGTGGALFRNIYCDFLHEATAYISSPHLREARTLFTEAAHLWTAVASAFKDAAHTQEQRHLDEASAWMMSIASLEERGMKQIAELAL